MTEQSAAHAVVTQGNPAEMAAVDIGEAVVPGEAFVDEGVSGAEQVECAPILVNDGFKEQLGFPPEGLPQVVVEIREDLRIGSGRRDIP